VRVLAATNRNLEAPERGGRATGNFRQDLYYRLSVFTIHLPPLRERGDDLVLLVRHYVRRFARKLGKDVEAVAPEALELLKQYPWPGNVRELQNALEVALLNATGPVLLPEFLPDWLPPRAEGETPTGGEAAPAGLDLAAFLDARLRAGSNELYAEAVRELERILLPLVLRQTGGNQLQAAKLLGITRGSLRTKLRELGLRIDRTVSAEEDGSG
jgi:two-component system nitrogen regulation response regulator GlnG